MKDYSSAYFLFTFLGLRFGFELGFGVKVLEGEFELGLNWVRINKKLTKFSLKLSLLLRHAWASGCRNAYEGRPI